MNNCISENFTKPHYHWIIDYKFRLQVNVAPQYVKANSFLEYEGEDVLLEYFAG